MNYFYHTRSTTLFLIVLVGFVILIARCKRKTEDAPVVPINKPGPLINLDTIPPKILDLYIPKFPSQNITIDQTKQTITVIVPIDWQKPYQDNVVISLSANASWAKSTPIAIDFCAGRLVGYGPITAEDIASGSSSYSPQQLVIQNGTVRKTYTVFVKPAGDMYFSHDTLYQLKSDQWKLPKFTLYNLFDGDDSSKAQAVFTQKATGVQIVKDLFVCAEPNNLLVDLPALQLGEYTFQIKKSNGRATTNALRFNLIQGEPTYYSFGYNLTNYPAKDIWIEGRSLYSQNNTYTIQLWHNRTGVSYNLSPYIFAPNGIGFAIKAPNGLQAGYYYSRLLMNGQPYGDEHSTIISKDSEQPMFYEIQIEDLGSVMSKHEFKTIPLKRGSQCGLIYGPYKRLPMQVRLEPVTGDGTEYIFDVKTPIDYGSSPSFEVYPYFTIPIDVKKGSYLMSLQYKTDAGVLQRGEPLERDIVID